MTVSKENWETLFPQAKETTHHLPASDKVYLPLSNAKWLELVTEDLTSRERYLLSLLTKEEEVVESQHPWHAFLVKEQGKVPKELGKIQFLHAHIWKQDDKGWLEMMTALLPNLVSYFQLSEQDLVFVLNQERLIELSEALSESLQALEFDFGVRLTLFLGQVWSRENIKYLPHLFQAEAGLFSTWQDSYQQSTVLSFSKLFLWGQGKGLPQNIPLATQLRDLVLQQENLKDIILALWEEGAVVTKAAQRLYLHRNTLQYRLEKWHEQTGLQLKELTDLTLCYSLILDELF